MNDFLSAAISFPTVLWTVPLVLSLLYWVLVMLGAVDLEALDVFDAFDGDVDVDVDTDADAGGGLLDALGLVGVPLTVILSVLSLVGWAETFAVVQVVRHLGTLEWLADTIWGGMLLLAVTGFVALVVTAFVVRPLAPLMRTRLATGHHELVGRYCTITTLSVDERFGQAEVADHEGATLLVQVRAAVPNALHRGERALLFDYDAEEGTFRAAPSDAADLDPEAVA